MLYIYVYYKSYIFAVTIHCQNLQQYWLTRMSFVSLSISLFFFFLNKVWIGKNQCKENASRIIDVVCTLQYQSKRFTKGVILIPFILKEHIEVPIRPFFKLYQQKELYLCDHSRDYCIMHACIIWGICRRIRFILGFSSIHILGILLSFW